VKGERWLAKVERWSAKDEKWSEKARGDCSFFLIGGIVYHHCLDFLFIICI
jgi:hypothetical protein